MDAEKALRAGKTPWQKWMQIQYTYESRQSGFSIESSGMGSAGKGRPYTSEKGRAMQDILLKLVRSVVLAPEKVVVTQITAKPPAYKIQVAQPDFQPVLSKIHAIKTLALTIAGLPTGETLILHLDVI